MSNNQFPRLVADIGGTGARFALQLRADSSLSSVAEYACASFAGLGDAVRHYLREQSAQAPRQMAVGVAAAVTSGHIELLNNSWSFSRAALQEELQLDRLLVLNDFAALALSLPSLTDEQLQQIGGGVSRAEMPKLVIGPGTGLGLAALAKGADGRWSVISGEGGHSSAAAVTEEQAAILHFLRHQFGHVSTERLLSGPGLVNLYRAAVALESKACADMTPRQVVEAAHRGDDVAASKAVRLFIEFLGSFAGSQALSFGALGGVYLGGGVLGRLGSLLDVDLLRQQFEAKGRLADFLRPIPIWLIRAPYPALQGALRALDA